MNLELESMAIEMPEVEGHPNRVGFRGVLTFVGVPSDRSPSGARGHRVTIPRKVVDDAIPSLLGMNVLAADPNADAQASGGSALPAVGVLPGSSAVELVVGAGAVGFFSKGDLVAVDVDYQQQSGYVGSAIAGAYVRDPANVKHDIDFVRRVTFSVGRVAETTSTSLLLAQPLPAGAPVVGAAVQRVVAFVDREGGAFFQEWSALFVLEAESGGRVCFYYPRLTPCLW